MAIMSDHWEEVAWDREALANASVSPRWYLDGKVGQLDAVPSKHGSRLAGNTRARGSPAFLVPMHGGIWTMCVALSGESNRISSTLVVFVNFYYRVSFFFDKVVSGKFCYFVYEKCLY